MSYLRSAGTAASVLLALSGCGSSTTQPAPPLPTATASSAPTTAAPRFRIVNGAPGTGSVDVYIYPQGSLRPLTPTFADIPFGGITPYVQESNGIFNADVLRAGAVQTAAAIASSVAVNQSGAVPDPSQTNSMNGSIVISGTNLNGTRNIQYFLEPFETPGRSALVVHHASPAANVFSQQGPIGVAVYSAVTYPAGTTATSIAVRATQQIAALTFVQNPRSVAFPNTVSSSGEMLFLTPFPVAPLPSAVGFAVGLSSTSAVTHAPLTSVIANAALSETANENSPFAGQNALSNDASQTVLPGTHISEFLIDADQNGNVGLIGTVDP